MKRFNMIDENFICKNCGMKVTKLGYTARDHCNYCLYSLHVDNLPGDRSNNCHGLLKPIGIEKYRDTYKIIYECENGHSGNISLEEYITKYNKFSLLKV